MLEIHPNIVSLISSTFIDEKYLRLTLVSSLLKVTQLVNGRNEI